MLMSPSDMQCRVVWSTGTNIWRNVTGFIFGDVAVCCYLPTRWHAI